MKCAVGARIPKNSGITANFAPVTSIAGCGSSADASFWRFLVPYGVHFVVGDVSMDLVRSRIDFHMVSMCFSHYSAPHAI